MKIIRCFLLSTVIVGIASSSLTAMKRILDEDFNFDNQAQTRQPQNYDLLTSISRLSADDIRGWFQTVQKFTGESVHLMGLRLIFAKKFKQNLDDLDCVYFFNNIECWVNKGFGGKTTPLLTEQYLRYVLPVLQFVCGFPIEKLYLNGHNVSSLPQDYKISLPFLESCQL